mgnify:FL=1
MMKCLEEDKAGGMFKQNSKYRLRYLIVMFVLLITSTVLNFYDFYERKNGMSMIGGIVFGLIMIAHGFNIFELIRNKKRINSSGV